MRVGAGPAAVDVVGFGFRYSGRPEWAVRDMDVRIEPGERILLTGASGSGKSTLLTAMAGLLGPDSGDARGAVRSTGVRRCRRETGSESSSRTRNPSW